MEKPTAIKRIQKSNSLFVYISKDAENALSLEAGTSLTEKIDIQNNRLIYELNRTVRGRSPQLRMPPILEKE